jgi:tRNA G18 (ribose-2'-O)-methylase SpoU
MEKIKNEDLGRLSVEDFLKIEKIPVVIVLDNVRSALNVGSVFRTADAFRVNKIYLCGITPVPPNRDILKSALGATETVQWEYVDSTLKIIEHFKQLDFYLAAIEQTKSSIPLQNFVMPAEKQLALIFGHEVNGVDQEVINLCNASIEIPQQGTKHSLNISVCAGVVLWEIFKKYL